jgi:hypothetical protein
LRHGVRKTTGYPGFNFNVEEWFEGDHYEIALARAAFEVASRGDGLPLNANWLF